MKFAFSIISIQQDGTFGASPSGNGKSISIVGNDVEGRRFMLSGLTHHEAKALGFVPGSDVSVTVEDSPY